jgi:hypothetical protein
MLKIITADERAAERGGVKALILGPYGIGKTSLLRTLDAKTTLFIDGEAGDLAVQDVEADTMRPTTWPECRFIAALVGGPNPAFPETAIYGVQHHQAAVDMFGADALAKYETIFVDSITKVSRLALQWAQQQPEAFNQQGKPDLRGAYGLLGREMIAWITQLQHARGLNIIFTCAMEQVKDDFGRLTWEPHLEGSKTGRELPGIVDEVISYALVADGDGGSYRAFITNKDNEFGLPAKDRSGRLEPIEEPHLGKLIAKASDSNRRRAGIKTTIPQHADTATEAATSEAQAA